MSRAGLSQAEVEATVLDAEQLADELERAGPDAPPEAALFVRALRSMAKNLRTAMVSPSDEVVVMKMVLGLETTIRRVSSRNLVFHESPPASQRPTLPPPAGLTPREVWESIPPSDRGPETARCPTPKSSEIRAKAEADKKKKKSG